MGNSLGTRKANIRSGLPFNSFKGRTYAAAVSTESSKITAELGVGLLIIPHIPWKEVDRELPNYREIYREVNCTNGPAPILAGWTFYDEDGERAP